VALREGNPDLQSTPHGLVLQRGTSKPGAFVNCSSLDAPSPGGAPPLDAVLCDLLVRGNESNHTDGAAPPPGEGAGGTPLAPTPSVACKHFAMLKRLVATALCVLLMI
jgi:hypothetical protein